jgi:hypothetical protein
MIIYNTKILMDKIINSKIKIEIIATNQFKLK